MPTNELKPCPFCGGEAVIVEVKDNPPETIAIQCKSGCCISVHHKWMEENVLIEAWNTRAERTCTFSVYQSGDEHFPTCSACGYEAAREECEDYVGVMYYEKRFCPNCGARLVQE